MPSLATRNQIFRKFSLGSPVTKCESTLRPLSGASAVESKMAPSNLALLVHSLRPPPRISLVVVRVLSPPVTRQRNVVIPRLAAAFNLTTLLLCDEHPNGAHKGQYCKETITNHYSRIVYEASVDGRGMCSLMVMLHRMEDMISTVW